MSVELRRREFLTGAGAAAAAGVVPLHRALAIGEAGPAASGDLAYRSAGDLVAALAAKHISSVELTDFAIARIEALDKPINAVVVHDFDRARSAAKAADAALAHGETRPLLGLPMTVKEAFNVVGLPTTWGNPKFEDWQPNFDSLAVTRLKAAGAVILGKTNVPFMLEDWQSFNEIYGATNNPWNLGRTPGGSSGGAAAALAAGFVALELGSDFGGSLRCPAHFCGVFAHKPSLDLVPLRGAGPPHASALPVRGSLAVAGPMARSAADLALELGVLAGPDELTEGVGYKLALPPARHQDLKSFRALVIDTHPLCPTATSVQAALDRLAEGLGRAGASVARTTPLLPDPAETARVYVELLAAGNAADLSADAYQHAETSAKSLPPDDEKSRRRAGTGVRFQPSRLDLGDPRRRAHPPAMAGSVQGVRRGAVPADADAGLCPRPHQRPAHAAARHRRQESPLFRADRLGQHGDLAGPAGDRRPDRAQRRRPADRRPDHRALSRRPYDDRVCWARRARIRWFCAATRRLNRYLTWNTSCDAVGVSTPGMPSDWMLPPMTWKLLPRKAAAKPWRPSWMCGSDPHSSVAGS